MLWSSKPRPLESVVKEFDEGLELEISNKHDEIFIFFLDRWNEGTESEFDHKLEEKYELYFQHEEFCFVEKNKLIDCQYEINREDIEFEYNDIEYDYDGCLFHGSMIILDHYFKVGDKYQTKCWCFEYHIRNLE